MVENINLGDLGLGALEEKFQVALKQTIANILDPNTSGIKRRDITVKIGIKPESVDRRQCKVTVEVKASLAAPEPAATVIYIGMDPATGVTASSEYNPQQMHLFNQPMNDKVTPIRTMEGGNAG
ncbi:MAG: hypothetical protein HQK55_12245 [Deltaproteobacteria bacterium]|nr:hypothetical protein [Deltaproteobacteria bacterium]